MHNLAKILKSWKYQKRILVSPPFGDIKSYVACKHMLIREWITADYVDSQRVIRIPMSPESEPGKSNIKKLAKLKINV